MALAAWFGENSDEGRSFLQILQVTSTAFSVPSFRELLISRHSSFDISQLQVLQYPYAICPGIVLS